MERYTKGKKKKKTNPNENQCIYINSKQVNFKFKKDCQKSLLCNNKRFN